MNIRTSYLLISTSTGVPICAALSFDDIEAVKATIARENAGSFFLAFPWTLRVTEVEVPLSTAQATTFLAQLVDGASSSSSERVRKARGAMDAAYSAGREWLWDRAAEALGRAYQALGATPPALGKDPGYAWHQGVHPIQAARAEMRALVD